MTFHVGQKVVCVNNEPWIALSNKAHGPARLPAHGEIFTVAHIVDDPGCVFLAFREITESQSGHYPAWDSVFFRPVKTTDISVFRAMLAPGPKVHARLGSTS